MSFVIIHLLIKKILNKAVMPLNVTVTNIDGPEK